MLLQHCSRMETVSAQFLTMLAHQLVCWTVTAFLASFMGPICLRTISFLLCVTASVLGMKNHHVLQQQKSTLRIVVACDSDSQRKC